MNTPDDQTPPPFLTPSVSDVEWTRLQIRRMLDQKNRLENTRLNQRKMFTDRYPLPGYDHADTVATTTTEEKTA